MHNLILNVFGERTTSTFCICECIYSTFDNPKCFFDCLSPFNRRILPDGVRKFKIDNNLLLFDFNTLYFYIDRLSIYQLMSVPTYYGPMLCQDDIVGPSKRKESILILRDPYNSLALSVIQKRIFNINVLHKSIGDWLKNAREFTDKTNYMGEKILINYNDWFSNRDYRIEKIKEIGGEYNKVAIYKEMRAERRKEIAGLGGLVDFDNIWKILEDNDYFKEWVIKDKEVEELSNQIFGKILD